MILALRALGIGRGDRITVYMPLCPETIALLLATVRIGAIHSVVFAGFGAGALYDRMGRTIAFTEAELFDDVGEMVARATFSYRIMRGEKAEGFR